MRVFSFATVACLTFALTGCYEESGTGGAQRSAGYDETADTEPPTSQPTAEGSTEPQAYGNSRSTLGKARDNAEGVVGDLEKRDRELQKQIDDDRP